MTVFRKLVSSPPLKTFSVLLLGAALYSAPAMADDSTARMAQLEKLIKAQQTQLATQAEA